MHRYLEAILGDPGTDSGDEGKSKRAEKYGTNKSKERREEPLGTMSYQTNSKRSPPFWLLIGARKLLCFSAQLLLNLADPLFECYFTEVIPPKTFWWLSLPTPQCLHFPSQFEWSPLWILRNLSKITTMDSIGSSLSTTDRSGAPLGGERFRGARFDSWAILSYWSTSFRRCSAEPLHPSSVKYRDVVRPLHRSLHYRVRGRGRLKNKTIQ